MTHRRAATATVATAVLLVLGACGSGDEPAADPTTSSSASAEASADPTDPTDAAGEGVMVDISLTEDGPDPQGERVEVTAGEPITLNVTSEIADEVHVHSDPEVSIDVEPGDEKSETFTIDRPGQVAVESHATHTTIVQLVVRP